MTIAFVSDAVYPYNKGGKEKRLYELSTRLAALGHDVNIYTMHWWEGIEKSRNENGVQLHALSRLYPLYSGDRRSIKQAIFFGLACLKLVTVKFDILDVDHMPFFPIFSAWLVTLPHHRKFFATWHEALTRKEWVTYMGPGGNIASLIEWLTIKLPYGITAASEHTKRSLGRTKRVSMVPSGIDLKLINSLPATKRTCDVLYVGRLVKDKHVDQLVRAMEAVVKQKRNASCLIIGHGIEKAKLTKLIHDLKLQKNVTMLDPFAKSEDVYSQMKSAKVFCLPSTREGFGIVALESLASGTPVVTIDAPNNATKDLIKSKQDGLIVPLNPGSISSAIKSLLVSPRLNQDATSVSGFDWDKLAKKQLKVYAS